MKIAGYEYQSCFGPYIQQFLQEKRDAGFIYESEEWILKHFDAFCFQRGISQPFLSKELITEWGTLKEQEEMVTCSKRISVLRQFGFYMISLGKEAYIPRYFYKSVKRVVHILSDEEIVSVFKVIDGYIPSMPYGAFHRLAAEYKVLFRLLYCCGLRISEVRSLHTDDVDLDHGRLRIMQSKGRKDRMVYLSEDLTELLREYVFKLSSVFLCQSAWFFPARNPEQQLSNVTIDKRFRDSWAKTPFAKNCDRNPTVHCLRHSFVVKRMNLWMEEGVPLKEMLPFLSKFLGHTSPKETLYYYHQIDSAFRIIRSLDKTSAKVIPGVTIDE